MRILEGALLDVDGDEVRSRIDAGDVLVAVETADSSRGDSDFESSSGSGSGSEFGSSSGSSSGSGPVIAAIVLVPRDSRIHIEAVAVRRSRRGRGIGSALVRAGLRHAEDRGFDRVTAGFDRDLREFYADMGFSIGAIDCSSDDCSSDDFPSDDSPSDDSPSDDQLLGMVAVEPASDDRSPSP